MARVGSPGGRANNAVRQALLDGKMRRQKHCSACGAKAYIIRSKSCIGKPIVRYSVVAHHDDYSKPLDVRWLCLRCHVDWHMENEPKNKGRPRVIGFYPRQKRGEL